MRSLQFIFYTILLTNLDTISFSAEVNHFEIDNPTAFESLPMEVLEKIFSELPDPRRGFAPISEVSRAMNSKVWEIKKDDPNTYFFSIDGVENYWYLDQLSMDQMIQHGFTQPQLLRVAAKEKLHSLKPLNSDLERFFAIVLWDEVFFRIKQEVSRIFSQALRDKLGKQACTQIRLKILAKRDAEMGSEIRTRIAAEIENQARAEIGSQLSLLMQSLRERVKNLIHRLEAERKIAAQVAGQVEKILTSYANLESSSKEQDSFVKDLVPTIGFTIDALYLDKLERFFEEYQNDSTYMSFETRSVYEAILEQFRNVNPTGLDINFSQFYELVDPSKFELERESLMNLIYPFQKYSEAID